MATISRTYHRVLTPFVGISGSDENFKAVTLEPGTHIAVEASHTGVRSGLVEVVYEDMVLRAYLRDIEDRTELVNGHAK